MSKSYFENTTDTVHTLLASMSLEPKRGTAPYYRYGAPTFNGLDGSPPRVRYRPSETAIFVDSQKNSNIPQWQQDIICRVWGSTEDEVMYEVGILMATHRLVHAPYFGTTEGVWVNIDTDDNTKNGFMFEFPIKYTCELDGFGVGPYATITDVETDVSGSLDFETSGSFFTHISTSSSI